MLACTLILEPFYRLVGYNCSLSLVSPRLPNGVIILLSKIGGWVKLTVNDTDACMHINTWQSLVILCLRTMPV